jgi:hypothetical protein
MACGVKMQHDHSTNPAMTEAERFFYPFEKITSSPDLDGSLGKYRYELPNPLNLKNDVDAAGYWLQTCTNNPRTYNQYRRCLDVLLNWAIFSHRKAFSSFEKEDFSIFDRYLASPHISDAPYKIAREKRGSLNWSPIRGGLTISSRKTTLYCIMAFVKWLDEVGYARFPGRSLSGSTVDATSTIEYICKNYRETNSLTLIEWLIIRESAEEFCETTKGARACAMLDFLYYTSLNLITWTELDFLKIHKYNLSLDFSKTTLTKYTRQNLYLIPEIHSAISRWVNIATIENPLNEKSCKVNIARGQNDFRFAKSLAIARAQRLGMLKSAEKFQSASLVQLRGAFADHIAQSPCAMDAWQISGITTIKGPMRKYLPKRYPLTAAEYIKLCEKISEQIRKMRDLDRL